MAVPPSRKRSVGKVLVTTSRRHTSVIPHRADRPSQHQEPGKPSKKKASEARGQEEPPKLQDKPAMNADVSRAFEELQRLQHSITQLQARQESQDSQATSAGPLRLRQQLDSTSELVAATPDRQQTSPKELQHQVQRLPSPSVPRGVKRGPESELEPTISKRNRKRMNSEQLQQPTSQHSERGSQPAVLQQSVDDVEDVRPEHKSSGAHPKLAEAPTQNSAIANNALVPPPIAGTSDSRAKNALPISQTEKGRKTGDELDAMDLETYFLRLGRIKCYLEGKLNSEHSFSGLCPILKRRR
jgi:hypothetical protein